MNDRLERLEAELRAIDLWDVVNPRCAAYHKTDEVSYRARQEGIGNRVGPASNCEAAGRESATVFPAVRFAGYRQSA